MNLAKSTLTPPPPAKVAQIRDYLLYFLTAPPDPVLPAGDLAARLRAALGLLKFLELADIEARLVELESLAQQLKHQPPYGTAS
jgi:hypothetical protein